MSKFYAEIAKYYDDIFPLEKAKLNLIKEIVGDPPKAILDVASGSGEYAKELSQQGYHMTAIDLDENMIKSLREKSLDIESHVLNIS